MLFLIMLGMGLSLVPDDFRRVVKYPKAVALGLSCQLLFLPIVGFGLANLMPIPPELAVGVMLPAVCPGGTTSNLFAHLAKGDVALSVTLTPWPASLPSSPFPLSSTAHCSIS